MLRWSWIVCVLAVFTGPTMAADAPKPPLVFIISGGFGTCSDNTHLKMMDLVRPIADSARQTGRTVKFIVTCFSILRPSEDFEYFSFENGKASVTKTIPGGKDFEQVFQSEFIETYLDAEIPEGARVASLGQSHGGWVAASVAAKRPVDFVVTLDPISRTECNARNFLFGLQKDSCKQASAFSELMGKVDEKLDISKGRLLNLYQTASFLHSGPLQGRHVKNIDFALYNPKYGSTTGKHVLSTEPHQSLATDTEAWKLILGELDRRLASLDPDWKRGRTETDALSFRHGAPRRSVHQ